MSNIDQKLQTNVVVEEKNALDNIGLISEALTKVSKIDFSNMAKAFGDMNNALKATANTASKTSSKMIEMDERWRPSYSSPSIFMRLLARSADVRLL